MRIYTHFPNFEKLSENVWAVYYPKKTAVLDVTELIPNLVHWIENSSLTMGNWKSMAEIKPKFSNLNITKPQIFHSHFPVEEINTKMENSPEIYLIGFDMLQIPRFRIKISTDK